MQRIVYKFLSLVFTKGMENRYVFVLLRVKYRNEGYRMLHPGVRFNMTTIHLYLRLIIAYVESRNNHYRDDVIEEICFKFFIITKREEKSLLIEMLLYSYGNEYF